jgi:hypothetical protein
MLKKETTIYIPDEEDSLNFMEIKTGSIAGILYRSSSPIKGGEKKRQSRC